jgi:hypothetical protein
MGLRPPSKSLEDKIAWTVPEAARAIKERRGFTEEPHTGCWIQNARTLAGYGAFLSTWEATYGPIPAGLAPYHKCHGARRGCVRPSHMDIAPEGAEVDRWPNPGLAPGNTFRARLRDERESRQATRQQFAAELGVSIGTVASWEDGRSEPSLDEHDRLERRLGWSDRPQKFIVTLVMQQVVVARSSGAAARQALDELDREEGDRKLAVYRVVKAIEQPKTGHRRAGYATPVRSSEERLRRAAARARARRKD